MPVGSTVALQGAGKGGLVKEVFSPRTVRSERHLRSRLSLATCSDT